MTNVCVPNGSPMVSRLVIEVQGDHGNITSVTLDQMLRAAQRVDVRALGVFLVEEPSCWQEAALTSSVLLEL